jgi:hypothetical protein
VRAQHDKRKVSKASSCNNIFPSKVLSGCTENFNPRQLWHMLCTILEVPLGSFLSIFNHDHLPSCSSFWHKCKESNRLILPWLRFASKSLLQIFIKVGSLVGLVAELLLPSISLHMRIGFRGSMQQQECSSFNCHMQFISLIIVSFLWNLVCLKHENLGSMSFKALVES